jgi:hypothetical protein
MYKERLRQKVLDLLLGRCVAALAEVRIDDAALLVDQVDGRPVLVAEGLPGGVVVVLRDRVLDAQFPDRVLDVFRGLLVGEFGRVHADHHQAAVLVLGMPVLHVGKVVQAVDAGVGPEVDEHHLAAQLLQLQRLGVEPLLDIPELGRRLLPGHRDVAALRRAGEGEGGERGREGDGEEGSGGTDVHDGRSPGKEGW